MKKIGIILSLLAICFIASCSKDEIAKNGEDQREEIVIWSYYETEAQQKGLDWLVQKFNLSQDKYRASWMYVPMTDFTKRLAMAYTEENLPDIALLDNPNMTVCIQMGMCEDMTDFLKRLNVKENYYTSTVETVSYDNKMYGLPAVCNNLALIYNKSVLADAGITPPQTWNELEEAVKKLTTKEMKGILISAKEGEQGAFQLLPWILSTGEAVDGIGGKGTEKAFSYLNQLMEDGYMTKNCINLSQTDVATAFVNQETAMMVNGPWVFSILDASNIDYGISKLPIDEKSCVIVGGEDFAVMKGKNVEGAQAFFTFYNQNEIMGTFCEKTYSLPTKMDVEGANVDDLSIFKQQMDGAVVRSTIPHWMVLSDDLPEAFYKMVSGQLSPKQAADSLKVENN